MADTAKAAGVGPTIAFKDRSWQVSPITPVVIGRFEVWLEDCGWKAIERYALNHSPADVKRQEDAHRRDCATDVYSHGSECFRRAALTMSGMKEVLRICIHEGTNGDAAVTPGLIEEMFREKAAEVRRVLSAIDWCTFEAEHGADQSENVGSGA